jgi:hypothetical protein
LAVLSRELSLPFIIYLTFQVIPNADLIVPRLQGSHGSKIFLPARDDAAEFDDSAGTAELRGLVDDKVGNFQINN